MHINVISDPCFQKLVDQLCEVLKTPEAFNEFRLLSSSFRDGTCTAQAYYEHCQSAMSDKFQSLYPELLAMLPDIGKQQVSKEFLFTWNQIALINANSNGCLFVLGIVFGA